MISCLAIILAVILCVPVGGAQSSEYGKILQIHLSPEGSGYVVSSMAVMYGEAPNLAIRSGNLKGVVLDAGGKELQSFSFPEPGTTEGDILGPDGQNSLIGFAGQSPRSELTLTLPYIQDMQQFTLTDTTAGTILVRADLNAPVSSFCTDYPVDPDCLALHAPPQTAVPDSGPYLYLGALFAISLLIGTGIAYGAFRSRKMIMTPSKQVVLIVDDDSDIAALLHLFLERKGFATLTASGGRECLDILKKQVPDLILLDIMMEPMDGWETLEQIKNDATFKSIPVLMLTGKQLTVAEAKQYNICIEDYIMKPFRMDDICTAVDGIFQRKRKLQESLILAKKAGVDKEKFCELARLSRNISVNRKMIGILSVPKAIPAQVDLDTLDDMLVVDYFSVKIKDKEKRAEELRGEINTAFRSKGFPELTW
jgi:DNA-binding response OmpR family regulator